MNRCFYGVNIVVLGGYEAIAFTTHAPTVTALVKGARRRYGRLADAAIAAWLTGLAVHLYR